MSGFDPRFRLGFAALVLGLTAMNVVTHGPEALMALEAVGAGLLVGLWVGWTGIRDLRRAKDDEEGEG